LWMIRWCCQSSRSVSWLSEVLVLVQYNWVPVPGSG
jgi:hypothetical protein